MSTFNTDGMLHQSFPFHAPLMDYIFHNAQPQHLLKLYQCSKYFYAKFAQFIHFTHHLEIAPDNEEEVFGPTKTVICASNPILRDYKNLWILDTFTHRAQDGVIPSFVQCKKLILHEFILWEDYKLLTKNVEILKIKGVFGVNGIVFASVEAIIAEVPNAKSIEINETVLTPTTHETLLSLDRKTKISNFVLKNVERSLFNENYRLIDFILDNTDYNYNVEIGFKLFLEVSDADRLLNDVLVRMGNLFTEIIIIEKLEITLEEEIRKLYEKMALETPCNFRGNNMKWLKLCQRCIWCS